MQVNTLAGECNVNLDRARIIDPRTADDLDEFVASLVQVSPIA